MDTIIRFLLINASLYTLTVYHYYLMDPESLNHFFSLSQKESNMYFYFLIKKNKQNMKKNSNIKNIFLKEKRILIFKKPKPVGRS